MSAVCATCEKQKQASVSVIWCPECEETFCCTCAQHHELEKLSEDHYPIPYDDYLKLPPFILNVNLFCSKHSERYQYFCRVHDQPICSQCIGTTHKKCRDTPELNDVIKKVKTSMAFENVMSELVATDDSFSRAAENQEIHLKRLQEMKQNMLKAVDDKTHSLLKHIEEMKQNMIARINDLCEENTNIISRSLLALQSTKDLVQSVLCQMDSIQKYATNFQTFIGIKEIEKIIEKSNTRYQELSDQGQFDEIEISLEETNSNNLSDATELFGNVKVSSLIPKIPLKTGKANQAQMMVPQNIPTKPRLQKKMQIEKGGYTGCCMLTKERMVIIDSYDGSATLYNRDGSAMSSVRFKVQGDAYDVTKVEDNHVAVSNPISQTISIVNVKKFKVAKTLKTGCALKGITCKDGNMIFCVSKEGIFRLDIKSEKVENVTNDITVGCDSHIVAGYTRICYTCPAFNVVNILDSEYNPVFKFSNDNLLTSPVGIAVDDHMTCYTVGSRSKNLLAISSEGRTQREIGRASCRERV